MSGWHYTGKRAGHLYFAENRTFLLWPYTNTDVCVLEFRMSFIVVPV